MLHRGIAPAALALVFAAGAAHALPGTFRIDQVYSNADGSVQFVSIFDRGMNDCDSGENEWQGLSLVATGSADPKTFVFPRDLPTCATSQHYMLIATQGFADLGLVAPDFVIPNGFVPVPDGRIEFAGISTLDYRGLPTDGVNALSRSGAVVVNRATNLAGQSVSLGPSTAPARNYQGLWWASPGGSESGWGINFAHQGDVIFATWFTYDTAGKPLWLTMTASKTGDNAYAGTMYRTRGPAFSAVPFDPNAVTATAVGSGTLAFADASSGTFAYTVDGISQSKAITRQAFGPLPTCTFGGMSDLAQATNYQDLWWASPAGSESGWGINFTHQGEVIFATWFTYDATGSPMWLSGTARRTAANTYTGPLQRTGGPAFSSVPFEPSKVTVADVGTYTLTFANGNAGTFGYSVDGVAGSKPIVRQVFRSPGTACR